MVQALVALGVMTAVGAASGPQPGSNDQVGSLRLPDGVPPVIVACFWSNEAFEPDGYKPQIDLLARHSGANLLATSIRAREKEVTDEVVYQQIKAAATYAGRYGMRIAMDLDVRLARRAFRKAHPDELQEMLRLREVALNDAGAVTTQVRSNDLSDHYTGHTVHYIPLAGRLLRVYAYARGADGIRPETVRDVTKTCKVTAASAKEVAVRIPSGPETRGLTACVMVAFTHLTPAVFAPHLDAFQRRIIERYGDTDLVGVCKDEWGFPPCFDGCPAKNDYWYSRFRAEAYAKQTGGRDLLRDCLLMTFGERGRQRERQACINRFLRMSTLRNAAIEDHFYRTTKAVFGPSAVVATHPTWYPYPGLREFKKNGLDWWMATHDMAQTDEVTPYCARTSLAKKWGSGVWWNMYYAPKLANYEQALWAHALGGGRIDYHPVYPHRGRLTRRQRYEQLLRGGLMRGDCRVRLLNFISSSPLDCPVAVVFGHACAMNWAGPSYDDVGIAVTDGLWRAGFPADLIPSTEIGGKALTIDQKGYVRYGPQRYHTVVLYHPEFETPATAALFQRAAQGKTKLYRVGDWTRDFAGKDFDGNGALPRTMEALPDAAAVVTRVIAELRRRKVTPQTPATRTLAGFGRQSAAPSAKGQCRLIDGTVVVISGAETVSGDVIDTTLHVGGHEVTADAVGVIGVRLRKDGSLDALAAGGLKRFKAGTFEIELPQRVDVALWRDRQGDMHGVLQGCQGPVPAPLSAITTQWRRLAVPTPLP